MKSTPNTLAILVVALLTIAGSSWGGNGLWLYYICKPLTAMLIIWRVCALADAKRPAYRKAVLIALVFSLLGDVFLMLPKAVLGLGFELGLASFLVAHLFLLRAFTRDTQLFGRRLPLLLLVLVSFVNLAVLWPTIGTALRLPVLAYMLCLVAMSAQAISRALSLGTAGSKLAAWGGLAFLISDTTLAYNKFYAPIPASPLLVLGTYYAALYLIARSAEPEAAQCVNPALAL